MREYWQNWNIWDPEKEPVSLKQAKKYRKISICTTCMNRTQDLKKTLIQNINDNSDYPNIEFVVLNYNSSDNMHKFMTSNDIKYLIKMGIVKYYITRYPKYYSMSHSRNISFLNSTGSIVTNVDADNYTGKGFADYLNKLADICPEKAFFSKGKRMMHGRIGMYKNEFISLGGYNEDFSGYGFDDHDLMIRSMNSGYKLMWWAGISPNDFTNRIKTSRSEVGLNMENKNWRETEKKNKVISMTNIASGKLIANVDKKWGYVPDLMLFKF
jgi:hypothetical protein